MATLALSAAGASISSVAGFGPGLGWRAGAFLGERLWGEAASSGPSLTELKFTGSAYGAAIPQLFGTMRLGGNILWAGPLEKKRISQSGIGKGGLSAPSSGTRSYEYSASFAVGLAKGPLGNLLKVWADGNLIYDVTESGAKKAAGIRLRFYSGGEEQQADSIIAAEEGEENTPAFRGLAYLVFETLPLADYGNRLPNIEVLLTREGVANYPQKTGESCTIDASNIAYDPLRQKIYTYEVTGGVDLMQQIDARSLSILASKEIDTDFPKLSASTEGFCLDRHGIFWIGSGFGFNPGRRLSRFNAQSMALLNHIDLPSGIAAINWSTDVLSSMTGTAYQVAGSQQNGQVVVFDDALNILASRETDRPACTGALTDQQERAWLAMSGVLSTSPFSDLEIVEVTVTERQGLSGTDFSGGFQTYTLDQSLLTPEGGGGDETNTITRLVGYLKDREELVFQNDYRLFKWSLISHQITAINDGDLGPLKSVDTNNSAELVFLYDGRWIVYLDAETLIEKERVDLEEFSGVGAFSQFVYDVDTDSVLLTERSGNLKRLYLRRVSGSSSSYREICEALSLRAGMSLEQIDVSGLSSGVPGYLVNRPMTVQQALDPIVSSGQITVVESGFKIRFSETSSEEYTEIQADSFFETLEKKRVQESEMPRSVSVSYMAVDGGYQSGSQIARRSAPAEILRGSSNDLVITLPMALTSIQAKKISHDILYTSWTERQSFEGRLPLRYLALDPVDVIRVTFGEDILTGRVEDMYIGADFSLELKVSDICSSMIEVTGADTGTGYPGVLISRPLGSELLLLDLPLLKDTHATAGLYSRYYYAVAGREDNWRGAALFMSDLAGERYEQQSVSEQGACWGIAVEALGATENPWQTDKANSLTARILENPDQLESVTEEALLNGANALLVGQEILQFSDLEILEDGNVRFSHLLRGRRGTEGAIGHHKTGERILLLTDPEIGSGLLPLSHLETSLRFKAVTAGQLLEEAPVEIKRFQGRDLKPYAPVHIKVGKTAETLSLSWKRRSRIGGSGSLSATVPLAETSERYELEFHYQGKSHSEFITGSMQAEFSLSFFEEAFESSFAEIPDMTLALYQLSEAVGRGNPAKEEI
ncbi:MAG: phage tail protein [Sneathiellales bacterium]|nr:phage tail protein [Sneathiellales bacterium]